MPMPKFPHCFVCHQNNRKLDLNLYNIDEEINNDNLKVMYKIKNDGYFFKYIILCPKCAKKYVKNNIKDKLVNSDFFEQTE